MSFFKPEKPRPSPYLLEQAQGILNALGGEANIASLEACITRLRVKLHNLEQVNEADLEKLGSKHTIHLDENQIHLVLGKQADEIVQCIKQSL